MSIGSVVALKSGGPDMTVTSISQAVVGCMWFECMWFELDDDHNWGQLATGTFPLAALEEQV